MNLLSSNTEATAKAVAIFQRKEKQDHDTDNQMQEWKREPRFRRHYLVTFNPELEEFDSVGLQELYVRLWIRLRT